MANNLTSNPLLVDNATTAISTPTKVRLIQWVDTNAAIVDNDDLNITINGGTLNIRVQLPTDVGMHSAVFWSAGPFNPGINVSSLIVNTIDGGAVMVWIE
jgi:hypothetical protein